MSAFVYFALPLYEAPSKKLSWNNRCVHHLFCPLRVAMPDLRHAVSITAARMSATVCCVQFFTAVTKRHISWHATPS